MTNIRNDVWKVIDRDQSIRYDLSRALINVRALARHLKKSGLAGSEDAIISAIRRYPQDSEYHERFAAAIEVVSRSKISTRSNIANIAVRKSSEVRELLPRIFSSVDYERGDLLRFVQGEGAIRIIVDEKNVKEILEIIPKKYVLEVRKNLSEINIHLPSIAVETRGVGATVLNELFRNGVLLYEVMSCVPEFIIIIDDRELLRAYQVLHELCNTGVKK